MELADLDLAWHPRLTRMATTGKQQDLSVWHLDLKQLFQGLRLLHTFTDEAFVAWSPDGKFVTSSDEKEVRLWDSVSGRLLHILQRYPKRLIPVYR
jgi:WD40 repeat protein